MSYTISLTFTDQEAANPLEVAKKFRDVIIEDAGEFIYDVEDEETGQKYTVDLSEDDEDAVLPNND